MKLLNKRILVVGSGISGIGVVTLLGKHGITTYLYDANEQLVKQDILNKIPSGITTEVIIGELPDEINNRIELVILSPGVPVSLPFVIEFKKKNIPIIGEIELAYLMGKGTVIGITGTNGKTTTTALAGAILRDYFNSVFVVGNIGVPYTSIVDETEDDTVTVVEISSFQLETTDEFHPAVSAILNVTPDHLDRHGTMENYIQSKCNITKRQTKEDACILNYDNEITRELIDVIPARPFFFSRLTQLEDGVCLQGDSIVYIHKRQVELICHLSELKLLGVHNIENVCAAAAIAISIRVPIEVIRHAVIHFTSVEHRIEYVAEKAGVVYYNDSKGTNTDAAIKGIQAMTRPTVLLAGGYNKKSSYDDWIKSCVGRVKCLVLIGQTKEDIAKVASKYGIAPIFLADTFEEAMDICTREAVRGDAVLLSPACASWGMFENYEQRGNRFKEYVKIKI